MRRKTDWHEAIKPLLKKYRKRKHPLEYKNVYQLVVMVVMSARDSDKNINQLSPAFFAKFPDMKSLSKASAEDLYPFIHKVRNFANKAKWLTAIAGTLKKDEEIPLSQSGLTALPGIGRKSANVIMREARVPAEGVIVDLHVVRVATRLGIAKGTNPDQIEKQIMEALPDKKDWELGMALSFLGREICRPTDPKHELCPVQAVCEYCRKKK